MTAVFLLFSVAAAFWFVIFSPWTQHCLPFWPSITTAACILAMYALVLDRKKLSSLFAFRPQHILVGLLSALTLYAVFAAGSFLAARLCNFAGLQIEAVYDTRRQADPLTIGLLLFFLIAPAEEILWRGFLQRRLCERAPAWGGYLAAVLLYAAVHIWSFNLMLITAALVCGAFWGAIFHRYKSLWPVIISHAVWDVLVFVLFPFR